MYRRVTIQYLKHTYHSTAEVSEVQDDGYSVSGRGGGQSEEDAADGVSHPERDLQRR